MEILLLLGVIGAVAYMSRGTTTVKPSQPGGEGPPGSPAGGAAWALVDARFLGQAVDPQAIDKAIQAADKAGRPLVVHFLIQRMVGEPEGAKVMGTVLGFGVDGKGARYLDVKVDLIDSAKRPGTVPANAPPVGEIIRVGDQNVIFISVL